jgi:hypothetical protein
VTGTYSKSGKAMRFESKGLSIEGASRYMFNFFDRANNEEREMSVAEYFTKVLGIRLQFPNLQCVLVRLFLFLLAMHALCSPSWVLARRHFALLIPSACSAPCLSCSF